MLAAALRRLTASLATVLLTGCEIDPPPPPPPRPPDPDVGALLFQEKCANCHTIGLGMRTGPDLHAVGRRRERAWLLRIMKDPVGMTKTDPIAREQLARANNVPMPPPNLDDAQIGDVLAFIAEESARVPPAPPAPAKAPGATDGGATEGGP